MYNFKSVKFYITLWNLRNEADLICYQSEKRIHKPQTNQLIIKNTLTVGIQINILTIYF